MSGIPGDQQRVLDSLELEFQAVMSCQVCFGNQTHTHPLQEQQVLLTAESSFQPVM